MFALPALSIVLHGNHIWPIAIYLVFVTAAVKLRHYFVMPTNGLIKNHLRSLVSYGVWVTVTGIIGPLIVYGDRFFVSAAVGVSQLPIYAIPQEGLQRLLIIPAALCGALLPQLTGSTLEDAAVTYKRNYKRVTVVMFGICLAATAFAYPALS